MNLKVKLSILLVLSISSLATSADVLDDLFSRATDSQRRQAVLDARKGDFDEAISKFKNVLIETKNSPDILCDYVVILKWAGRYDEAAKAYSEIPKDFRIPDSVQLEMAVVYYKLGKFAEALSLFEKYLPKTEKDRKLVEMMVESCVNSGNSGKALKYLDDRSKSAKEIPDWLRGLSIMAKHGKAVEAARGGRFQEALDSLGNLITETNDRKNIYYDYIVVLSWDRQYKEALKAYMGISSRPDLPSYLLEAVFNCYEQAGDQAGKLEIARKLALASPVESKNLELMTLCCQNTDSPEAGIETVEALMKRNPDKKELISPFLIKLKHMLAIKLARNGEHGKSLAVLDGLLKESGNNDGIMADYILVLSWSGKKDDARRIYGEYFKDKKAPEYLVSEITGVAAVKKAGTGERTKAAVEPVKIETAQGKPRAAPAESPSLIEQYVRSGNLNAAIDEAGKKLSGMNSKERENLNKSLSEIREKAIQEARDGKYEEAFAILDRLLDMKYETPAILSDKIIIMVWSEKYEEAIGMYTRFILNYTPGHFLLNAVGSAYRRTGKYNKAMACYDESLALEKDDPDAVRGKVFSMIEAKRTEEAYDFIQKEIKSRQDAPEWLKILTGEAYVVEGRYDAADTFFTQYLRINPGNRAAERMLVEVLIQKRQRLDEARKLLDELLASEPRKTDLLFLKVTLLQLARQYLEAYALNEKILAMDKTYQPSINARYHILLDIKADLLAKEILEEKKDHISLDVKKRIMGDLAAEQLSWRDPAKALAILNENMSFYQEYKASSPANSASAEEFRVRTKFDTIMAYFQEKDMGSVIKLHEELVKDGVVIPYWIKLTAASAYLYNRNPEKALSLYYEVHDEMKSLGNDTYPENYDVLMGIYSSLIELEKQRAAYEILNRLEKEGPAFSRPNGVYVEDPNKMEVATEKGWWYIYNDQLPYADEYLSELLESAPYNSNVRTALAYVHYYQGYPRLALEDFQISVELDPNDKSAQMGLAYTLNANDDCEKARSLAAELAKAYPKDLDVKELLRSFELQEMRTLTIDSNYANSGSFSDGSGVTIRLDQPIYPDRKIYTEETWLYTSQPKDSNQEGKRRNIFRGAVGFDWRLDRDLTVFGEASMDYHAENPGFMAGLKYKPTDHLTLTGFYNSYTLNMPPKALLFGKKGQEANISTEYRFNDDLILGGGFSNVWVSDGNLNQTYSWKIDKGLYSSAYWKFRVALEGATTTNTKYRDSEYYAPRYYTSIYLVPMVEHLWYRQYETSITDRMFIGVGPHWEKDFNCRSQYYIRYEQEYVLTDTFSFKIGGSAGKERYGSDSPFAWGFYSNITWKF